MKRRDLFATGLTGVKVELDILEINVIKSKFEVIRNAVCTPGVDKHDDPISYRQFNKTMTKDAHSVMVKHLNDLQILLVNMLGDTKSNQQIEQELFTVMPMKDKVFD